MALGNLLILLSCLLVTCSAAAIEGSGLIESSGVNPIYNCYICGNIFYNGAPAPGLEVYYYSKEDRGWPKPIRDDTVTSEDGFFDLRFTLRLVDSNTIVIRHQFIVNETDPMEDCESNFSLTWIELSRYRRWPKRLEFELSELGSQTRCFTKDDDKERLVYGAEHEVLTSKFTGRVLCNGEPVDNIEVTLRHVLLYLPDLDDIFASTRTKNGGYYTFYANRITHYRNVALGILHDCCQSEDCQLGWLNSLYFQPGWSYYYIKELKEELYEFDFELSQPIFNQEVEDFRGCDLIETDKGDLLDHAKQKMSLEVILQTIQKDFELEKQEPEPSEDWMDSKETN